MRRTAASVSLLLGSIAWSGASAAEPQRTAIVGAKVYVSPYERPIADAVILVENGIIKRVGPRSNTPVPRGYRTINHTGHVVTAGFWNSHVHLTTPVLLRASAASDADLARELEKDFSRWGFTTVFDLASTTGVAAEVRRRSANGPRVLSVAEPFYPADATPIYARPFYKDFGLPSAEVRSAREATSRVTRQIGDGASGVKLFTGSIVGGRIGVAHMQRDIIVAATKRAHQLGRKVFAHPTDRIGLELAINNGVDILAHSAPLMGQWSEQYARWIASRNVALVPSLSLVEIFADPSTPIEVALQQTTQLHKAGGVILFGTDAGFTDAFDTTGELRLMGRAIGWKAVLASLTTNPARVFGESAKRGRIAPGYIADLVVVAGDPAQGVENLANVRLVMKSGKLIFAR